MHGWLIEQHSLPLRSESLLVFFKGDLTEAHGSLQIAVRGSIQKKKQRRSDRVTEAYIDTKADRETGGGERELKASASYPLSLFSLLPHVPSL